MATKTTDIIIPEVLSAMISAQIPGNLALAGTDRVVTLDNLQGKPGDRVKIPRWSAIGEFAPLTEGVAMTPVNLTANSTEAVVKEFGKSVEITELALMSSYEDPLKALAEQFARYAAMAVDKELIKTAETTTLSISVAATISLNAVIDAKALFSDEQDDIALVLHPKVYADLLKLSEFKTLTSVSSDVIQKGQVGTLYGMPVYVSRFLTKTPGTPDTYTNLLVKRAALGLWYKKQMEVKKDVDILKRTTVIAASSIFATTLFQYDPLPVVKLITQ
jgi:N4-gp56 family major capsid protein